MNLLVLGGGSAEREHVARVFHAESRLRRGPFVVIRCGHQADDLVRSLLADLEACDGGSIESVFLNSEGGTLFLDEIDRLPLETQRLLFEFLRRGRSNRSSDSGWAGRIAAGSEWPLDALARQGRFHAPLLDALDKVRVHLRPLA